MGFILLVVFVIIHVFPFKIGFIITKAGHQGLQLIVAFILAILVTKHAQ